ncbi:S26 family signal peptidase [Chloroflexota bacterium]
MTFPWISIYRIKGDSMIPIYYEGDFVILSGFPFTLNNLSVGDDIVFYHKIYSTLIKRIVQLMKDDTIIVKGINSLSVSGNKLGPIQKSNVKGKVILHISKPT